MNGVTAAAAERDGGYAVIAAMICAAAFALTAMQLTATSRGAIRTASAEAARARLDAEAEAGLAIALAGLQADDPQARWTLGAEPRTLSFDDAELTITVEDERGKIPLNSITPGQARLMFQLAGAADPDTLAAALVLQRDPEATPAPGASERGLAGQGTSGLGAAVVPTGSAATRKIGLTTVRDLLLLPGMTPEVYATLAPSVSVSVRDAAFEPRTATPFALSVMGGDQTGTPAAIEQQRAQAGETPALDTTPPLTLAGRPLTIRVQVRDGRGDHLQRANVVELTRARDHPYILRSLVADGA